MNAILKSGNPADAAREAIRRLAMDRIAPTPENFARAYREAAGEANVVLPEQVLSRLGEAMRARRPEAAITLRLSECIREGAWADALNMVNAAVVETALGADPGAEWPRLLQNLLARLDATTPEWTRARKLGAVEHVLRSGAIDAGRTREKLERLIGAWSQATVAVEALVPAAPVDEAPDISPAAKPPPPAPEENGDASTWREIALAALEGYRMPERRAGAVQPRDRFSRIRSRLIDLSVSPDDSLRAELKMACADYQADQLRESAIRERLKALLRLVCDNLNLFADDDAWVKGQVDRICQLLDAPLDELALTEAEDSLRAAVLRQSELKLNLAEAKAALKEMIASLIERLSSVAASTGDYYRRIGESAGEIRRADDLASLSRVVEDLLDDTGAMQDGIQQVHAELNAARDKADSSEQRVQALEQELAEVSSLVRTDPLTQVLNRRGLEDAFAVEQARVERENMALTVALLDIDNFKRLNDSLGHQVGDMALRYLTDLVSSTLRPTDTVARFGGEEFVILLPATNTEMAVTVLTRLQRMLTRALFLHNDEKILITFSAGITQYRNGESRDTAIGRADDALYLAKSSGKNRVVVG